MRVVLAPSAACRKISACWLMRVGRDEAVLSTDTLFIKETPFRAFNDVHILKEVFCRHCTFWDIHHIQQPISTMATDTIHRNGLLPLKT
jgi:hypothetical protein